MVARIWGKVDGQTIPFSRTDQGWWKAEVPASDSGTYVLELWAEDQAGNVGYFATVKVTFDEGDLQCSMEIISVGASLTMEEVQQILGLTNVGTALAARTVETTVSVQRVSAQAEPPDRFHSGLLVQQVWSHMTPDPVQSAALRGERRYE